MYLLVNLGSFRTGFIVHFVYRLFCYQTYQLIPVRTYTECVEGPKRKLPLFILDAASQRDLHEANAEDYYLTLGTEIFRITSNQPYPP